MKFGCIIIDPPWQFGDKLKKMKRRTKRSAASNYSTMTLEELKSIQISSVTDDDACVLAMWCPSTMLQHGLELLEHYGFTFKGTYVWVKTKNKLKPTNDLQSCTRFGMGRLFRQSHEIVLLGTKGKNVYKRLKNRSQRSVVFAPNAGHSVKPDDLHVSFDLMYPGVDKLEVFARRSYGGWTCVGNEIDGKDVRDAVEELARS